MKLKENVDLWSCFEGALERKDAYNYSWRTNYYEPINDMLELENEDWIKAIELCKQFKKSPLKKEMELGYEKWLENPDTLQAVKLSNWLGNFKQNICSQRRNSIYSNTNTEIKEQIEIVFKEHFELLERFRNLNSLFNTFTSTKADYLKHKLDYDNKVKQLETFRDLKNSGLQPQDFDWSLIEPQVEDEV